MKKEDKCLGECISKEEIVKAREMIEKLEKEKAKEFEVVRLQLEQVKGMKELLFAFENGAFKEEKKEEK